MYVHGEKIFTRKITCRAVTRLRISSVTVSVATQSTRRPR